MAAVSTSTLIAPSPPPRKSPSGRITRRSPKVQELQSVPIYVDIYTGSPLSQHLNWGTQSQSSVHTQLSNQSPVHTQLSNQSPVHTQLSNQSPVHTQLSDQSSVHTQLSNQSQSFSHAHPDPLPRWQGPRGFGARHINDHVPFSLWSEDRQDFRKATRQEMRYIVEIYNAERIEFQDCLIVIETFNPPKPVPLTVACTPAIFVPPGQKRRYMYGSAPYANPRVRDPCPHLGWRRMQTPRKSQMIDVISVLTELANIQRVNFLPTSIVVELVHGDGRVYPWASLPGVVAGLTTTYHHDSDPFFSSMRDHTRERLLDPSQCLPGPLIGPAVQSTTCGILLRKRATRYVSVANHGFLATNEVFHPAYDGDKIGEIAYRYPELDIAMVQLTPANSSRFSTEPPKRLVETYDLAPGTWFEVDGMSTGLLSFLFMSNSFENPVRPPGHPRVPFLKWQHNVVSRIFGASNRQLMDGLCGAPFVEERTGNVAGFFHLANGDWAECAALDDLIAEGWEVA